MQKMKLYYHHVGQNGASDFEKTVFTRVDLSIIANIPDEKIRDTTAEDLRRLFPSGQFNCWGVPVGAGPVINNLAENDYVLLIQSTRIDGFIPALCHVKFYLQYPQPALSKALWGDDKFPYIFFFDTERLYLPWNEFVKHLSYKGNYSPRGQFLSVDPERLTPFGGTEGYIQYIRAQYSKSVSGAAETIPALEGLQLQDEGSRNVIENTSEFRPSITPQQPQTPPTLDPNSPAPPTSLTDPEAYQLAQAIITQGQLESDAVEQKATSDIPIQSVDEDKLGFAIYVRAFRDFIASQDTSTPLTIGIYGTWGSGKSSLMYMIKNELDPPFNSVSKRWLRHLWWQWFRSYLGTLRPWLSAKLQLWLDDRRGRALKFQNTYVNQPDTASIQTSAASKQGSQPKNKTNNAGTNTANSTATLNHIDNNQRGQDNDVDTNTADPAQNGHSNPPYTSASITNGHAGCTQNSQDDSQMLNKIGGPKRFQKIREDLRYTPSMPKEFEDSSELQKMRAGLSYDPSTTDKRLEDLIDPDERHWAKVAAAHCPMVPLTHPTIWFNAWKFDQEEQLWAALALEVMDQIKQKYGYVGRILFWVRLSWKRSSHLAAFWGIIWRFVLPIVLLLIAVTYTLYITSITSATVSLHIYDYLGPFSPKGPYAAIMPLFLLAGAILSGIPAVKIIKDPFQITVKDIFDKPNYKDKVGFIGNFEKDFSRIVSVATRRQFGWKPQKLVIFIDDLDRCEPPKAADIIEGINLFLDSDRCVFVLGMDPNAVAASIENKYKDLFEKMRRENTAIVSPGRLFLDKIIQVPFNVPPATENEITELMTSIMLPKAFVLQTATIQPSNSNRTNQEQIDQKTPPETPQPPFPPPELRPQIDRASYKRDDIQQAIKEGAKFLPGNPRLVKKYMNLFRFYVYIADERGVLWYRQEGTDKPAVGLTLDRLAIWVSWSVRWVEIARSLSEEVQLSELRDHLLQVSKLVNKDGLWCLMEEATKVNPSIFGHSTLIPMERYQLNKNRTLVYEKIIQRINRIREAEKNTTSHWSYLPWEWWLLDINFRKGIWEMQSFWKTPQNSTEVDWLQHVLTMTRTPALESYSTVLS